MRTKRKKNLLWIWLVLTLVGSITAVGTPPVYAQSAVLSAPVIVDTTKTPGSSLSIDISTANVKKLFAFEFKLYYNATVLTATNYSSYSPFDQKLLTRINNTAGWVYVAYSMPMPEEVGFNTTQPAPIAKIDFTVNALGTSPLELKNLKLTEPIPKVIPYDAVDGLFANIEMLVHDIAITDVTAPSTVPVDGEATVTVAVENQGDYDETFNVSLYYDETLIENKTGITLSVGASKSLTFTWNTTGVADGTYTIKAEASAHPDEIDTADNTFVYGEVTIGTGEEEETTQDFTLYIVAAAAIVIIVAILVYALRFRKPKPPK